MCINPMDDLHNQEKNQSSTVYWLNSIPSYKEGLKSGKEPIRYDNQLALTDWKSELYLAQKCHLDMKRCGNEGSGVILSCNVNRNVIKQNINIKIP